MLKCLKTWMMLLIGPLVILFILIWQLYFKHSTIDFEQIGHLPATIPLADTHVIVDSSQQVIPSLATPSPPPFAINTESTENPSDNSIPLTANGKYPPLSNRHPDNSIDPQPQDVLWTHITNGTMAYRIAHYDDRNISYGGPVLITLVLFDVRLESSRPSLVAKVVYANGTELCLSKVKGVYTKLRRPKKDEIVTVYLIFFRLPTYERPSAAFICSAKDCSSHSKYLTVFWEEPPVPKLDFAVCLHQSLFHQTDHEKIAAWFEMNRALGAQRITVYYQEVNPKVREMIQKYVDEGFVDAFDWVTQFATEADNAYAQSILIIDCLHRNMHRAKYLALNDVDELLMPHIGTTWHEMVKVLDTDPTIGYFRFCHSFFHNYNETLSLEPIENISGGCPNLSDLPVFFKRTHRTAKLDCRWTRWKSMVIPLKMTRMAIHSGGPGKGYIKLDVPPNKGLLHHYRYNDYRYNEKTVQDLTVQDYVKPVMQGLLKKYCPGG